MASSQCLATLGPAPIIWTRHYHCVSASRVLTVGALLLQASRAPCRAQQGRRLLPVQQRGSERPACSRTPWPGQGGDRGL
jgi:hypothetical protein